MKKEEEEAGSSARPSFDLYKKEGIVTNPDGEATSHSGNRKFKSKSLSDIERFTLCSNLII